MAKAKTAWQFNPGSEAVQAALSAGQIESREGHTVTVAGTEVYKPYTVRVGGKGPNGRNVPVVKYFVKDLKGGAAALGNETRILKALSDYINRSIVTQTKEANIGPDRKLMKLAKDMAALVGGDVDSIFANLKAQHAASHPA